MSKQDFIAPWAEKLPDGTAIEYGPSPATHARRDAEHRNWAWRRSGKLAARLARSPEAVALRAYMRPDGEHLRCDVPKRELEIYVHVYELGHSVRWVARRLKLHRSSVRTYVRRLMGRAEQ